MDPLLPAKPIKPDCKIMVINAGPYTGHEGRAVRRYLYHSVPAWVVDPPPLWSGRPYGVAENHLMRIDDSENDKQFKREKKRAGQTKTVRVDATALGRPIEGAIRKSMPWTD